MTKFPTIKEAMDAANAADDAFERAIKAAGFKSRWDWNQHTTPGPQFLRDAYGAKVSADNAMHAAFERSRGRVPYVEVDTETAYGSTQRNSCSIRVF